MCIDRFRLLFVFIHVCVHALQQECQQLMTESPAYLSKLPRVLDLLQEDAVLLHARNTKRVGRGPNRDHEVVVAQAKVLVVQWAEMVHRKSVGKHAQFFVCNSSMTHYHEEKAIG